MKRYQTYKISPAVFASPGRFLSNQLRTICTDLNGMAPFKKLLQPILYLAYHGAKDASQEISLPPFVPEQLKYSRLLIESLVCVKLFNLLFQLLKVPPEEQSPLLEAYFKEIVSLINPYLDHVRSLERDLQDQEEKSHYLAYLICILLSSRQPSDSVEWQPSRVDWCAAQVKRVIEPYYPDLAQSLEIQDPRLYPPSVLLAELIKTLFLGVEQGLSQETISELAEKQKQVAHQLLPHFFAIFDFVFPNPDEIQKLCSPVMANPALEELFLAIYDIISSEHAQKSLDDLCERLSLFTLALWQHITPEMPLVVQNYIACLLNEFLILIKTVSEGKESAPTYSVLYLGNILMGCINHLACALPFAASQNLESHLNQLRLNAFFRISTLTTGSSGKFVVHNYLYHLAYGFLPTYHEILKKTYEGHPRLQINILPPKEHHQRHLWFTAHLNLIKKAFETIRLFKTPLTDGLNSDLSCLLKQWHVLDMQFLEIEQNYSEKTEIMHYMLSTFLTRLDAFKKQCQAYLADIWHSDPNAPTETSELFFQFYHAFLHPLLFFKKRDTLEKMATYNQSLEKEISIPTHWERAAPIHLENNLEGLLTHPLNKSLLEQQAESLAFTLAEQGKLNLAFWAYTHFLVRQANFTTYEAWATTVWRWVHFGALAGILPSREEAAPLLGDDFGVQWFFQHFKTRVFPEPLQKIMDHLIQAPVMPFSKPLQKTITQEMHRVFEKHIRTERPPSPVFELTVPSPPAVSVPSIDYTAEITLMRKELDGLNKTLENKRKVEKTLKEEIARKETMMRQLDNLKISLKHREKSLQHEITLAQQKETELMAQSKEQPPPLLLGNPPIPPHSKKPGSIPSNKRRQKLPF